MVIRGFYNVIAISALMMLAGCQISQTVVGDGSIVSASGEYDCSASCEFTPPVTGLTETFTAVESDGYVFAGWDGLCAGQQSNTCTLNIAATFTSLEGQGNITARFRSLSAAPDCSSDRQLPTVLSNTQPSCVVNEQAGQQRYVQFTTTDASRYLASIDPAVHSDDVWYELYDDSDNYIDTCDEFWDDLERCAASLPANTTFRLVVGNDSAGSYTFSLSRI